MTTMDSSRDVVLVVDDEVAIREAVRDILELAGIPALLAADGQEAVDVFRTERDNIAAILLDVRMPVMSGAETYTQLRALDSGVPIIMSSGYSEDGMTVDCGDDQVLFFLRKPYSMDLLLATVRRAFP